MLERYEPLQPDPRIEEIDARLSRSLAPGARERLVAGRVFEASRAHLASPSGKRRFRMASDGEEGPSLLPVRSWSAWPVLGALAALVALATFIAVVFSVQSTWNNYATNDGPGFDAGSAEYLAIDGEFDSAFSVASSALYSDISATVESLLSSGDEWAFSSLASQLQVSTTNLWEDMSSF